MLHLAQNPFGSVNPPSYLSQLGGGQLGGIGILLNITMKTLIVIASVYAVFNFIMAGYHYISAAGDPKRIQEASAKIWQTIIGLTVAAGSIVIAGLVGQLLFGGASTILNPTVFGP